MTVVKEPSATDRLLRSITFLILFLAVFASFLLPAGPKRDTAKIEDLSRLQANLLFRLITVQVLSMEHLPTDAEKKDLKNAIIQELHIIDRDPSMRIAEVEVQRRMVLAYLGEDISGYEEMNLGPYREAFKNLYADRSLPASEDAILSLPAAELAVLDFYRRNDPERFDEEYRKIREKAASLQMKLGYAMMGMFAFMALGIYGWVQFVFRRPPAYFARFLETVKPNSHPVFMETAILFLFVMFPAGMAISHYIPEPYLFRFNFVLIPAAFLISLLYFRSETRPEMLRWLFWIPVYDQISSEKDSSPSRRPILSSLLREIGIGIVAWAVIFPLAAFATVIAVLLSGGQGAPAMHPVMHYYNEHMLEVFLLAVVMAPIVEEVIFRNFVYGFFRFRFPVYVAALFSGFFFAVIHPYSFILMPQLTVLGAGLAVLREHRPGILAPVVTHMIVNAMAFLFMNLLFQAAG